MTDRGYECGGVVIWLIVAAVNTAWLPVFAAEGTRSSIVQNASELPPAKQAKSEPEAARNPVPDKAAIGQAMGLIAEAFPVPEEAKGERAKAERIDALLAASEKTAMPARKYAFLLTAESAALASGSVRKAVDIAEARAKTFELNPLDARMEVITAAFTPLAKRDSKLLGELFELSFETAERAISVKDWQKAGAAARLAGSVAKATQNAGKILHFDAVASRGDEQLKRVTDFENALANRVRIYTAYAEGLKALGRNAADPDANGAVGHYLCFECEDWSKGLPHLAKAADAALKELATFELAHPEGQRTPEIAFDLAGRWWVIASHETSDRTKKMSIEQHSGRLYAECLGKLTDPLDQAIAEKRGGVFRRQDEINQADLLNGGNADALVAVDGRPAVKVAEDQEIGRQDIDVAAGAAQRPGVSMPSRLPEPREAVEKGRLSGRLRAKEARVNTIGMTLNLIPPGTFVMGSPVSEQWRSRDESSVEVVISKAYWMSCCEVTQSQWETVMGSRPWAGKDGIKEGPEFPALYVNWEDAKQFCVKLTLLERKKGAVDETHEYRLPTEAEWEYACRAGAETPYFFGLNDARLFDRFVWFSGNTKAVGAGHAHAVGTKEPNSLGLYDMHGNVSEWCFDAYAESLAGGRDPSGPATGSRPVVRGGSWASEPSKCRSACRVAHNSNKNPIVGFRVVLSVK